MPKGMGYAMGYRRTNGGYMGMNATYLERDMKGKGTYNPHYEHKSSNPNKTERTFSGGSINVVGGKSAKSVKGSGHGKGGTPRQKSTKTGFSRGR